MQIFNHNVGFGVCVICSVECIHVVGKLLPQDIVSLLAFVFVFLWGLVVMDAALNLYLLRVGGGVLLC